MTKIVRAKEIESVLALDAPARYDHFVKQAADQTGIWREFEE